MRRDSTVCRGIFSAYYRKLCDFLPSEDSWKSRTVGEKITLGKKWQLEAFSLEKLKCHSFPTDILLQYDNDDFWPTVIFTKCECYPIENDQKNSVFPGDAYELRSFYFLWGKIILSLMNCSPVSSVLSSEDDVLLSVAWAQVIHVISVPVLAGNSPIYEFWLKFTNLNVLSVQVLLFDPSIFKLGLKPQGGQTEVKNCDANQISFLMCESFWLMHGWKFLGKLVLLSIGVE